MEDIILFPVYVQRYAHWLEDIPVCRVAAGAAVLLYDLEPGSSRGSGDHCGGHDALL